VGGIASAVKQYGQARRILEELIAMQRACVLIEKDPESCKRARERHPGVVVLEKDALDEESLVLAGIERADGLISSLHEDGHNMIVVLNARALNREMKIGTYCSDHSLVPRFRRAGANYVVSQNFIGGMRLVSEMIRPKVTRFLDVMLRAQEDVRVEEVTVEEGSMLSGKTIGEADLLTRAGVRPIAISAPGEDRFVYNPGDAIALLPGSVLVVIAAREQADTLRRLAETASSIR